MGSSKTFETNNSMSDSNEGLTKSLLESATLSSSLEDNSAFLGLSQELKAAGAKDPFASELDRLLAGNKDDKKQKQDFSTNPSSPFDNPQSFTPRYFLPPVPSQQNKSTPANSATGRDPLTGQTINPFIAIKSEGTVTINGSSDFDGEPIDPKDDALIHASKGFTINGNTTLPVQRDVNGNPLLDAKGKPLLVDKAVTVAPGYTVSKATGNYYANLLPPQVIDKQTIAVPAYADIKQQELSRRIESGTPSISFNAQVSPLNTAADWTKKFPAPGTAERPTVVNVISGGLNIPNNVTLSNYVIIVERGDINFNGSGHNLNDVVLVANNGNINLANVQAKELSVFASGSINMNGSARFAGSTLLVNGSSSGNITFNGATATTDPTNNLKVISQGDVTFNGASDTRGTFLSGKNFTFNGKSTLYGSIGAKGNITFNGKATVIAAFPDAIPPEIAATLANDTAPEGTTNADQITSDPTITGTVTDASRVTAFKAGFNDTATSSFANVLANRNPDGSFTFDRNQLETIYGGPLPDGSHTLHLVAVDESGNNSDVFDFTFTLDTTAPAGPQSLELLASNDSGYSDDNLTNNNNPIISGTAPNGELVQLFSDGQLVGETQASLTGTWQIATGNLADGTHTLTATTVDVAGNVSPVSALLNLVIDTQAPTAPSGLRLTASTDSGSSNSDNITNNTTPTIQGTGEANSLIRLFKGGQLVGQTTTVADGSWQISVAESLSDGVHTFTAIAENRAGNVSATSSQLKVTVETVIATPTELDLLAESDSGSSNSDNITNSTTPALTGTAEAEVKVQLFNNGQLVGQTAAAADGSWQLSVGTLSNGLYNFTTTAEDIAGNISTFSNQLAVTIDTVAAAPTNLDLLVASDSGSSNSDNNTNNPTPTISGSAEVGALVQLFTDGHLVGQATTTTDGSWEIATSQLADGTNTLTATTIDVAGNISPASAPLSVVVDTIAPQLDLASPFEKASLNQKARLTGNVDGTGSVVTTSSYHFDNLAPLPVLLGTTGSFDQQLDFTGINEGAHFLTVTTTDAAGNVTTSNFNVKVDFDTTPPVISAALGNDTAPNETTNTDRITFDPTITGTVIDANSVKELRAGFDDTPSASWTSVKAQLKADGSFTFDRVALEAISGGTLTDGFHTLHLVALDEHGNNSPIFDYAFILDTKAPLQPIFHLDSAVDPEGDWQTTAGTVNLLGQTEVGASILLRETGTTTTASNEGQFQFSGLSLALGANSLTTRAYDTAGNTSAFAAVATGNPGRDSVLDWNATLLKAIQTDRSTPPLASRNMAMVHAAMYDAVNAITRTHSVYHADLKAPDGASASAAASQAAYSLLSKLYPLQTAIFDGAIATSLAAIPDGATETDGVALGQTLLANS